MTDRPGRGTASSGSRSDEPTLDQLLAEPIVRQLMLRDGITEATIRHLLNETGTARLASLGKDNQWWDSPPAQTF
jgi:hypothetical protein